MAVWLFYRFKKIISQNFKTFAVYKKKFRVSNDFFIAVDIHVMLALLILDNQDGITDIIEYSRELCLFFQCLLLLVETPQLSFLQHVKSQVKCKDEHRNFDKIPDKVRIAKVSFGQY